MFTRDGNTIYCDIPITITQATLGADLIIPMVDGTKESYRIPEGTQTGTQFTIRGKGFKNLNSTTQGNFVFKVIVQTPKRLSKEQRELLTQLAKTMNEQPPVKKKRNFWLIKNIIYISLISFRILSFLYLIIINLIYFYLCYTKDKNKCIIEYEK